MRAGVAAASLLALVLISHSTQARPLLRRAPETRDLTGERGIRTRALLALDGDALAELRQQHEAVIEAFPLGASREVTLELVRTHPLAHGRLEEVAHGQTRPLAAPATAYFTGTVAGEPGSRVLLAATATRVRGFVVSGGTAFLFGPDARGTLRSYDLRDVDETVHPGPGTFCDGDLHAALVREPLAARTAAAEAPPAAAFGGQLLRLDLAIETDTELRAKFATSEDALDYIAALLAAANGIYERDLGIQLNASYVRLWSGSDPWTRTSTDGQLDELRAYWTNPSNDMATIAGPRAAVHMLSGKTVTGGIAYIAAVCNDYYGYGVSQVDGDFDLAYPSQIWDVVVFTHELGHNVGSEHSHCYVPPLDRCYNLEPGCYAGPILDSHGSIMSYCHTRPGGLANIDLLFPAPVVAVVRQTVALAGCLEPAGPQTCGNGTLDAGEACDDGNPASGDGCSAGCRFEVCGNRIVDPGEECDDGNTAAQDGCASDCTLERCPIVVSHQRDWAGGQLVVEPAAAAGPRLGLKATFGVPAAAAPDVAAEGLTLLLTDASGAVTLQAALPGGTGWKRRGERAVYRDRSGTVAGIRKATVRVHAGGPVSRVKVAVNGVGGPYPEALDAMPRKVLLLLGDAAAVEAGGCGLRTYGPASCRSLQNGRKLSCK
ncbi:MAG TPA: M12 family metallo-peptidase [Candidatus Limnocylindria bacterium]|nr:M12 family metallo-peptidase [Candidatus Limnocylindria bacterium]